MTKHHGDGTIFQTPNGTWKAQLTIGHRPNGTRIRVTRTRKTKTEAQRALNDLRTSHATGRLTDGRNITLRDHITNWLELHAPLTCRQTTLEGYRYVINRYVSAKLKNRRLTDIKPNDIAAELKRLTDSGISTNTCKQVRALLSRCMEIAIRHELINSNPVRVIPVPKPHRYDIPNRVKDPLTREETEELIPRLPDDLAIIVTIAVHTGMRRGEILGLKWSDIDTNRRTIDVQRSLCEARRQRPDGTAATALTVNKPKTRNSQRTITMTATAATALHTQRRNQNAQRLRVGIHWTDDDWVFTTDTGQPVNPNGVSRRFRAALKRLGHRHLRFHDLRHTTVHLMFDAGVPLESVTQAVGHSSIAITKDIYARYIPKLTERAFDTLSDYLQTPPTQIGIRGA